MDSITQNGVTILQKVMNIDETNKSGMYLSDSAFFTKG